MAKYGEFTDKHQIGGATIKVNGQDVEVGISDSGTFYDLKTKTYSAKTLNGLQTKMQKDAIPKGGIPVEDQNGRKGVVFEILKKGYNRGNYRIRWDDDNTIDTRGHWQGAFYRRLTDEERAHLAELDQQCETTRLVNEAANTARLEYKETLSAMDTLEMAFPVT